jgi:hypothetical protein
VELIGDDDPAGRKGPNEGLETGVPIGDKTVGTLEPPDGEAEI